MMARSRWNRNKLFKKDNLRPHIGDESPPGNNITLEQSRIMKFNNQNVEVLKFYGISKDHAKPFRKIMRKDYSKKPNAPPGSIYYGIMKKDDFYEILLCLYKSIGVEDKAKARSISRAAYYIKDIAFTRFGVTSPQKMREIANNNFSDFKFCSKIYKKDEVIKEWNNYIDELQYLIQQRDTIDNPTSISNYQHQLPDNLEIVDEFLTTKDMFPEFNFDNPKPTYQLNSGMPQPTDQLNSGMPQPTDQLNYGMPQPTEQPDIDIPLSVDQLNFDFLQPTDLPNLNNSPEFPDYDDLSNLSNNFCFNNEGNDW